MTSRRLGRWWPRSLAGQLVLLLLLALAIAQLLVLAISAHDRVRAVAAAQNSRALASAANLANILAITPRDRWAAMVGAFRGNGLTVEIASQPAVGGERAHHANPPARLLANKLAPTGFGPIRVDIDAPHFFERESWLRDRADDDDGLEGEEGDRDDRRRRRLDIERARVTVAIGLGDAGWLNIRHRVRPPPIWAGIGWGYFLLTGILVSLVAVLVVRRATRPLRALADAAERLGRGETVAVLATEGPVEVARAAGAFNDMQARIRRYIEDRTTMLAAISHDLRTPITTLRLRTEFVEDEDNKARMLETLDEMAAMTEAALAFARDDAKREAAQPVDLMAMLDSLVEDLSDQGATLSLAEAPRTIVRVRPLALRRALRNLLENAVRYGERARITLRAQDATVHVLIDDDGPGIAADDLERVFEPFTRLETSRSRETGGSGLGLAIARSLIRAHGGEITLVNRPEGGLRATVELPAG